MSKGWSGPTLALDFAMARVRLNDRVRDRDGGGVAIDLCQGIANIAVID